MVDRLAEDHANAKYLAECLADVPGIVLDPAQIKTNMILFGLAPIGLELPNRLVERRGNKARALQVRGELHAACGNPLRRSRARTRIRRSRLQFAAQAMAVAISFDSPLWEFLRLFRCVGLVDYCCQSLWRHGRVRAFRRG